MQHNHEDYMDRQCIEGVQRDPTAQEITLLTLIERRNLFVPRNISLSGATLSKVLEGALTAPPLDFPERRDRLRERHDEPWPCYSLNYWREFVTNHMSGQDVVFRLNQALAVRRIPRIPYFTNERVFNPSVYTWILDCVRTLDPENYSGLLCVHFQIPLHCPYFAAIDTAIQKAASKLTFGHFLRSLPPENSDPASRARKAYLKLRGCCFDLARALLRENELRQRMQELNQEILTNIALEAQLHHQRYLIHTGDVFGRLNLFADFFSAHKSAIFISACLRPSDFPLTPTALECVAEMFEKNGVENFLDSYYAWRDLLRQGSVISTLEVDAFHSVPKLW